MTEQMLLQEDDGTTAVLDLDGLHADTWRITELLVSGDNTHPHTHASEAWEELLTTTSPAYARLVAHHVVQKAGIVLLHMPTPEALHVAAQRFEHLILTCRSFS